MEERIRKAVQGVLGEIAFTVERPLGPSHGDYATNAALAAAKQLGKNPREVADSLAMTLRKKLGDSVANVDVAGPGFVNITLSRDVVTFAVAEADAKGSEWGKGRREERKRVMIEYTQPNPFKEMHIGHLMSNTIGEAVSRLVESQVARANYQGDVGPHVAKALWGLQKARITEPTTAGEIGAAYVTGAQAYESDVAAKAEIDALNVLVYAGTDASLMALWRKGREISLAAFEDLYRVLGTKFDFYFFESEAAEPGLRVVQDGALKGVFEKSESAIVYHAEKKGGHTLVFVTSRGTPTYEAKELGLAFLKEERWPSDCSIVTTSTEQIGHFNTVLAALHELAPLLGAKTTHVAHGFLRLTTGKMSSREGNVITAAGFIADIIKKASEKNPDPLIAEQVAIGAIKYMILRQAPGSDIIFDPEKSFSLEGDSGPYLQYALVRAKSVLQKAGETSANGAPREPYVLERLIVHFPEIVARAAKELSPNLLTTYLTELAGEWNAFYAKEQIIGGEHEAYKLVLARAFVNTMQNGLTLLGIPLPERM